ncbi:MAG: hypothetical protein ACP5L4_01870 [Thermoplasmata archaeon]
MNIFKRPKLIDKKNDIWTFYCPTCHEWRIDYRHGYSSRFFSQMYFHCEKCGNDIEAPLLLPMGKEKMESEMSSESQKMEEFFRIILITFLLSVMFLILVIFFRFLIG